NPRGENMPGETVLVIDDSPTILKVVQLVLTKSRFRVYTAPDGESGLALAREKDPAMILLDFVMPGMNGYQVCRELAADPDLKDIPVVLMSAKGDQVGERFVKVMGIVDYITKPFSPDAITEVVKHTVTKYARRAPVDEDAVVAQAQAQAQADRLAEQALSDGTEGTRDATLSDAREQITSAVVAQLSRDHGAGDDGGEGDEPGAGLPEDLTLSPEQISALVRAALSDEVLTEVAREAQHSLVGTERAPSLRGDLRAVPIAEVLQLLAAQEQSGVLSVRHGESSARIFFRKGRVELAVATGVSEEFLFGRYVVGGEFMSADAFERFLAERPPGAKLIGAQLVKLGYLSPDDVRSTLSRQTRELIYEVLRWNFGSFQFTGTRELPAMVIDAALGLDVEGILMEGFRRVDEWHLVEREVSDFDQVFLRNEDAVARMGPGRLSREELSVLELVNGKNTVKDLVRRSRMGSFEVSKVLYRLLSIKLIRQRVMPVAV
ncbi:MAG: DUF4388 domain-containing protein, partial [Myxococcota bacterium]